MANLAEKQTALTPGRRPKPLISLYFHRENDELPPLSPVSPIFRPVHMRKLAQTRLSPKRNHSLSLLFHRNPAKLLLSHRSAIKNLRNREEIHIPPIDFSFFEAKLPQTPSQNIDLRPTKTRKSLELALTPKESRGKFPRSVFAHRRRVGV